MGDRDESESERVIAGYRVLRRIAAGDRATLYLAAAATAGAATADDQPALVVLRVYPATADPERLAVEVEAMSGDDGSAFPRLLDVATLEDGQVCLVVERLSGPSLASLVRERTLSAGEAVTVLAPIAAELERLARRGLAPMRLGAGDVLFDASGRPRLIGAGCLLRTSGEGVDATMRVARTRDAHAAYAGLVAEVARASRPSAPIDRVRSMIESRLVERPFVAESHAYERALFEAAAPAPVAGRWDGRIVRRSVAPPPSAAMLRAMHTPPGTPTASEIAGPDDTAEAGSARSAGMLARVSGLAAELLALPSADPQRSGDRRSGRPPGSLRARVRDIVRGRRAPLAVAALVGGAALVLALTVVPPAARTVGASASGGVDAVPGTEPGVSVTAATMSGASTGGPESTSSALAAVSVQGDDPAAATGELLRLRAECLADLNAACIEAIAQPGSAIASADLDAVLAAREGGAVQLEPFHLDRITVVGSMGAAWLMQVPMGDEREPASVLVMSTEAGWRLREIFD